MHRVTRSTLGAESIADGPSYVAQGFLGVGAVSSRRDFRWPICRWIPVCCEVAYALQDEKLLHDRSGKRQ